MQEFITVEDARRRILDRLPELGSEQLHIDDAEGRTLAESIVAGEDSPRFSNSARDGFAVRWDDLAEGETRLDVIGEVAAGETPQWEVGAGEAARIMTGAPVPAGADTIVMQEYCETSDSTVVVKHRPDPGRGAWIRPRGENMRRGEAVLEPGDLLGPAEIGLLASFQRSIISVARRPRVAIVSTGDELVPIDQPVGDGQIVNSNAHMLAALVRQAGGHPIVAPPAPDTESDVESAFTEAARAADMIVSSGGVSVGDYDVTRRVLERLSGGMDFWKIRMKPGKPLAFGMVDDVIPMLGLPGNPASSFVCFHQFVRPAMGMLAGRPRFDVWPVRGEARLSRGVTSTPRRRHYLSGRIEMTERGFVFEPFPNQNSGNLRLFCRANAFGIVEEGTSNMEEGASIGFEFIGN